MPVATRSSGWSCKKRRSAAVPWVRRWSRAWKRNWVAGFVAVRPDVRRTKKPISGKAPCLGKVCKRSLSRICQKREFAKHSGARGDSYSRKDGFPGEKATRGTLAAGPDERGCAVLSGLFLPDRVSPQHETIASCSHPARRKGCGQAVTATIALNQRCLDLRRQFPQGRIIRTPQAPRSQCPGKGPLCDAAKRSDSVRRFRLIRRLREVTRISQGAPEALPPRPAPDSKRRVGDQWRRTGHDPSPRTRIDDIVMIRASWITKLIDHGDGQTTIAAFWFEVCRLKQRL